MLRTTLFSAVIALAAAGAVCAQGQTSQQQWQTSAQHRASKIVGMDVQSSAGESLGEVEDLVLDPGGKVTHAIIGYGGTLGLGQKLTAVPWHMVSSRISGEHIVLEQAQLESAPSFGSNEWPNLTNANWSQQFDQYWQQQGTIRAAEAPPAGEPQSGTAQPPETPQTQPPPPTQPEQTTEPPQTGTSQTQPPPPESQTQPSPTEPQSQPAPTEPQSQTSPTEPQSQSAPPESQPSPPGQPQPSPTEPQSQPSPEQSQTTPPPQ